MGTITSLGFNVFTRYNGAGMAAARADMTRTQAKVHAAGSKMMAVGAGLSRGLTVPIAAAGGAGMKMANDFEKSMSKIVGLVGVSQKQVNAWEGTIKSMASGMGKSANEAADAMFFITSAGLRGQDAVDALNISLKASVAGLGETKVIAGLLTSAMNAYKNENLTAAQAGDVLAMAVREGKLEASELAGAMGRVLPIASSMGVGFNDVGAAMAAMSRTGTDANTATTQLRALLTSILKPSKGAEEELNKLGLSSEGLRKQLREKGLLSVLMTLRDRFDGNKAAMARVFPNVRALSGFMDLMGANSADTEKIFRNLQQSTGTLDKAFQAASQTSEQKLKVAFESVKVALMELGAAIAPAVTQIATWIGNVARAFNSLSEGTKKAIGMVALFAAAIGPLVFAIGKVVTSVVRGIVWFKKMNKKFNITSKLSRVLSFLLRVLVASVIALGRALLATPIGWVILAIAGLIAIVVVCWNRFEGFRNVVKAVWNGILQAAMFAWSGLKVIFVGLLAALRGVWTGFRFIGRVAVMAWNGILAVITAVWGAVKPVLVAAWNDIRNTASHFSFLGTGANAVFRGIVAVARFMWAGIRGIFTLIIAYFREVVAPVIRWLGANVFGPVFRFIGRVVVAMWRVAHGALMLFAAFLRNVVAPVVRWLWDNIFAPLFRAMGGVVVIMWRTAHNVLRAFAAFLRVVGAVVRWLWNKVFRPVWNFIAQHTRMLGRVLLAVFRNTARIIRSVFTVAVRFLWNKVVRPIWNFIVTHTRFLRRVVAAAFRGVVRVIRGVFTVAIRFVWNKVIRPIWNFIVRHTRFLRRVVAAAFRGVVRVMRGVFTVAVRFVWNKVIRPIWNFIVRHTRFLRRVVAAAFRGVVRVIRGVLTVAVRFVWNKVIRPVWNFIVRHTRFLRRVVAAAFRGVVRVIRGVLTVAVRFLWNKVIRPVWNFIVRHTRLLRRVVAGVFRGIVRVIRSVLVPVVRFLWNKVIRPVWNFIGRHTNLLRRTVTGVFRAIVRFIRAVVAGAVRFLWNKVIRPIWNFIGRHTNLLRRTVSAAFRGIARFIRNVVVPVARWLWNRVIRPVWNFIGRHTQLLRRTVGAAFRGVVRFIRNVVVPVARWFWNRVIRPVWNFIGRHTQLLTRTVRQALSGISRFIRNVIAPAARWIWNRVIRPVWNFIGRHTQLLLRTVRRALSAIVGFIRGAVAGTVRFIWNRVIRPVWNFIGRHSQLLWRTVGRVFRAITGFLRGAMAATVRWIWNRVIRPVWNFIGRHSQLLWRTVGAVFRAITGFLRGAMAATVRWIWNRIIRPIWNFIGRHTQLLLRTVRRAWDAIIGFITGPVAGAVRWIWNRIVRPIWNTIGRHTETLRNTLGTAFDAMGAAFRGLGSVFDRVANGIKGVWDRIRNMAKAPVRFLINTVYNSGVRRVWNAIVSKIPGVGDLGKVEVPNGLARGGVIPGFQARKKDDVMMPMRRGEGVLVPEVVRGLGPDTIHGLNALGNSRGVSGVRQFANGSYQDAMRGLSGRHGGQPPFHGFAEGGIFDKIKSFATGAATGIGGLLAKGGKLAKNLASGLFTKAWQTFSSPVAKRIGNTFGRGPDIPGLPYHAFDALSKAVKGFFSGHENMGEGDITWSNASARLKKALKWARSQHGKPYQWGGGGNPSWDCSGFMAGIENVIRGQTPGRRYTTFNFTGSSAPSGWKQGLKSPFMVGVTNKGVGHMAGSLLGVGVESAGGGRGVRVGKSARNHADSMFDRRYGFAPVRKEAKPGGGAGGGGNALFTSFWDDFQPTASGKRMRPNTIASSYIPLGSKLRVTIGGKSAVGNIDDLGPAKFVYDRHPGKAVIDLAEPMMKKLTGKRSNVVGGSFKILKVGKGRTLYGRRLRGYADGGQMAPGELAMVGERGPELFQAGSSGGQVTPHGTGRCVHIEFNDKVYVKSEREFKQMVQKALDDAERKR